MSVVRSTRNDVDVIRVEGRFDFAAHRDFREAVKAAVANAQATAIEIDLGGADYIDSSALGMLLLSLENAKAAGKALALTRPQGAVKQVLDIANFQRIFVIK